MSHCLVVIPMPCDDMGRWDWWRSNRLNCWNYSEPNRLVIRSAWPNCGGAAVTKRARSTVDDRCARQTGRDWGCFYWAAFGRAIHRWRVVRVPWSCAISCVGFGTRF